MDWRRIIAVVGGAGVAGAALLGSGPAATASGGTSSRPIQRLTSIRPLYDVGVTARSATAPLSTSTATAVSGLQVWSTTVTDGGQRFTYRMVGKNPFVHQATPNTTIKTALVPIVIVFSDGATWNPTVGDSCDTTSAVTRTMNSPVVKSLAWKFGGTAVGTGQYTDAFQRASFYPQTKTGGVNAGYHVTLGYTLQRPIMIHVPPAVSAEATIGCGNGKLGAVEVTWLDTYLRSTALPLLATKGFGPSTLPIFLLGNVVEYVSTLANCCVLGYHNATSPAPAGQTYAVSLYDNSRAFGGSSDVATLSHEVAEWVNDPFVNNATRPWGNLGQANGCQGDLEVGDPLTGRTFAVTMNGKTYRLQELAFVSWFYHQKPSTGVRGWYSNLGTFTTPAAACP
jgi:hypothetical protein